MRIIYILTIDISELTILYISLYISYIHRDLLYFFRSLSLYAYPKIRTELPVRPAGLDLVNAYSQVRRRCDVFYCPKDSQRHETRLYKYSFSQRLRQSHGFLLGSCLVGVVVGELFPSALEMISRCPFPLPVLSNCGWRVEYICKAMHNLKRTYLSTE